MKKFFAVIFSAVLISVCVCGCADSTEGSSEVSEVSQSEAQVSSDEQSTSELASVFAEIKSTVELPEMIELDAPAKLERYYGITEDQIEDCAGGVDSSGVGQDEIVIIKASSEENVEAVKTALQTRYDSKLAQNENYNADEAEKIRNCEVKTSGLYVYMIISNDADQINQIVTDAIGK